MQLQPGQKIGQLLQETTTTACSRTPGQLQQNTMTAAAEHQDRCSRTPGPLQQNTMTAAAGRKSDSGGAIRI